MADDTDHERIARKAHELWESEGHPHGRDQVHWDEAKEIIALEDSMDATLLPRDTGANEPEEPALAVSGQGDVPNLTDQGTDDLTATSREPAVTRPPQKGPDTAGVPDREEDSVRSAVSPVGNSAPVTGRPAPKNGSAPASVTQPKAGGRS